MLNASDIHNSQFFSTILKLMLFIVLNFFITDTVKSQPKETRDQKVLRDMQQILEDGKWIYNDLDSGFKEAKKSGKPVLVSFRCVPCENCVKLDEDLIEQDPVLKLLLPQFVLIRRVYGNGLDLQKYQFDTDQSFNVMFFNPDGTVYGRYGTRSGRTEWEDDVSLEGLAAAMHGALELHHRYDQVKESLQGKQGVKKPFARPELYPALKDKFKSEPDYKGEVAKSCIHCHMIGDAEKDYYRGLKQPMPAEVVYPYPHPKALGLILDPRTKSLVKSVDKSSIAETSGFKPGDIIIEMKGEPILSMADVQWVFHHTSAKGANLKVLISRNSKPQTLMMNLPAGWRELDNIDWRVGSWVLRRMSAGGIKMAPLTEADKDKLPEIAQKAELKIERLGQYGKHRLAKDQGFQEKDIILSWDGQTSWKNESELLVYGVTKKKIGDLVDVEILRNGKLIKMKLPMQD